MSGMLKIQSENKFEFKGGIHKKTSFDHFTDGGYLIAKVISTFNKSFAAKAPSLCFVSKIHLFDCRWFPSVI
jgi:hypothetical protein